MSKSIQFKNGSEKYYVHPYYPVGSIYISTTNTNPSKWFGGTWELWGQGRVPVGVSDELEFNTVEKKGGEKTHIHTQGITGAATGNTGGHSITIDEMAQHEIGGTYYYNARQAGLAIGNAAISAGGDYQGLVVKNQGGVIISPTIGKNQAHFHSLNNHTHTNPNVGSSSSLQPYITCYMWKRTA